MEMEENMSDWREFTGKTVDDALTNALVELETTSDKVEYEVLEEGSSGILGLFSKAAVIRVKKLDDIRETAVEFLNDVFKAMEMDVDIEIEYNEVENQMNIELSGDEMGMLIGKRGVTLDSLQYLVSLVINKKTEEYVKVKIDLSLKLYNLTFLKSAPQFHWNFIFFCKLREKSSTSFYIYRISITGYIMVYFKCCKMIPVYIYRLAVLRKFNKIQFKRKSRSYYSQRIYNFFKTFWTNKRYRLLSV